MRAMIILAAAACLAACGGKPQADATPAADTTAKAPAATAMDSTAKPAADTAKPAAPEAKPAAPDAKAAAKPAAAKAETGDHDKFIKPKFKIDEKTGKIDTIRKP